MLNADRPRLGPGRRRVLAWLEVANAWLAVHPGWFVVVFVALYGAEGTDAAQFRQLVTHPLTLYPDPAWQFLHSSPLPYFVGFPVAELFGPAVAFAAVTAAGLGLLGAAFVSLTRRMTPDGARTFSLVVLSAPLVLVLTRWIGKSDPAIVGFYLLLVGDRRAGWTRAVLATAIVLCHREVGSVIVVGHLILHGRRRIDLAALAGLALAHLAIFVYLHGLLPEVPVSRAGFAHDHAARLAGGLAANPLSHVVFSLGWFWMLFAIQLRRGGARIAPVLVIAILFVASVTFDFTRVAVLCALPVIVEVGLTLASDPLGLPRFLCRLPFPLVFLLQFQIEGAQQLRDSGWLVAPVEVRCNAAK